MKENKNGVQRHVVKCPHCGNDVLDHMTKCPHCKGELKSAYYDTSNMDSPARAKLRAVFLVITFLVVAGIIIWRSLAN